jgi:hypothetical protein
LQISHSLIRILINWLLIRNHYFSQHKICVSCSRVIKMEWSSKSNHHMPQWFTIFTPPELQVMTNAHKTKASVHLTFISRFTCWQNLLCHWVHTSVGWFSNRHPVLTMGIDWHSYMWEPDWKIFGSHMNKNRSWKLVHGVYFLKNQTGFLRKLPSGSQFISLGFRVPKQ